MTPSADPTDVFRIVIGALNDAGVPHMLVGSFASAAYGAERSTMDIDILIDPTPESLEAFTSSLLWLASPEDTVLAKLEWARMGESERQMTDVARVLEVKHDTLDHDYLVLWAETLGVSDLLERAQQLVEGT